MTDDAAPPLPEDCAEISELAPSASGGDSLSTDESSPDGAPARQRHSGDDDAFEGADHDAGNASLADVAAGSNAAAPTSAIAALVVESARRRRDVLSLVASENAMSPAALHACGSDLNHRYTIPPADERPPEIWEYPGQGPQRMIDARARAVAERLYGAAYADLRPLSGNNAVFAVISAVAERGDRVMRVPPPCGGHFATKPIADALGLELHDIPYLGDGSVDVDGLAAVYRETRPALVIFDASMVLFPPPIAAIRAALGDDAVISYDGSHTLGMIAGGVFTNPLAEGADLLHGSTHKSLFGPQKGMILCREQGVIAERIAAAVVPLFASNVHTHHVAALGVALEELELFGRDYAEQVVRNARAFATTLDARGLRVFGRDRNYTECHQLWVVIGDKPSSLAAFERLEDVGILANAISVPFTEKYGLRVGLSELTRRGLEERGAVEVAGLFADVVDKGASKDRVADAVRAMARGFGPLRFTYPEPGVSA